MKLPLQGTEDTAAFRGRPGGGRAGPALGAPCWAIPEQTFYADRDTFRGGFWPRSNLVSFTSAMPLVTIYCAARAQISRLGRPLSRSLTGRGGHPRRLRSDLCSQRFACALKEMRRARMRAGSRQRLQVAVTDSTRGRVQVTVTARVGESREKGHLRLGK